MSLFRRKDSPNWWVELKGPNGHRIQQSTGIADKQQAQEYHDRLKVQLWEQKRLGFKPRRTWQEATLRWLSEQASKATIDTDRSHLRWLDKFLRGKYLDDINRDLIALISSERLKPYEIVQVIGPARKIVPKPATVNRTLEIVRAILRRARDDWEWIDSCPKVLMLKEKERRVRWITREQAIRLIQLLPEHQQLIVRFALETGLRRRNITHLAWSQVDLERSAAWIHPDQAKARKAICVPLSVAAVEILYHQRGKHDVWVFPYRNKPITQVATRAWREAVLRAGIGVGFRWHDLRHTWASWHAQDGTPLHVLQELGAWAGAEMVQRYAHLSTEHLAHWVKRRTGLNFSNVGSDSFPTLENKTVN